MLFLPLFLQYLLCSKFCFICFCYSCVACSSSEYHPFQDWCFVDSLDRLFHSSHSEQAGIDINKKYRDYEHWLSTSTSLFSSIGNVYKLDFAIGVASGWQDNIWGVEVIAKYPNIFHLWQVHPRFFMKAWKTFCIMFPELYCRNTIQHSKDILQVKKNWSPNFFQEPHEPTN